MKLVMQIATGTFLGSLAMLALLTFAVDSAIDDAAIRQANASYEAMNRR